MKDREYESLINLQQKKMEAWQHYEKYGDKESLNTVLECCESITEIVGLECPIKNEFGDSVKGGKHHAKERRKTIHSQTG
jgi:hypothetical protein